MADFQALKLLRALDEGVGAKTGAPFFPHLVSSLAQTLNATCAFISEITSETYEAHVLAYWCEGKYRDPFVYGLSGTPCECVLDNEIVAFPRNISEMFPNDRAWFSSIGAQSFLAIPLCNEEGKVHGHLAVLDRNERDWGEVDFEILRIFSVRAGAELSRRIYEKRLEGINLALQKSNAQLRREVAQRLQTEDELATTKGHSEHVAELVRVLNTGITSNTGTEFFRDLVRSLAQALDAATVFIAKIDVARYEADILAMWTGGTFAAPSRFNLSATPCESVLDGQIAAFPRRVAQLFPAAREALEQLGTQSFLAIPITDDTSGVVGHIAVQDTRERDWNETDFGILRLFANRAAAELKRCDHESRLENTNTQFQKANAALRREVAARLDMEEQLAKAKQAAEAANQAKSNFLAHMSHELRTPLNGILGYAQLMGRDKRLDTEQLERVAMIERSGEHLLTLINDLLDLAKIEAGRLDLQSSFLELAPLIKHVSNLISVRAAQAGLAFTYRTAADLPSQIQGDERAIRQVLLNLLANAIKFTSRGTVTFDVSSKEMSPGRCQLQFVIEDSGSGIAAEDLQRIFEPFVRATDDTRIEGTGLGLPITKRLVTAMGGTIDVDSHIGVGSKFTVLLEFACGTRDAAETEPGRALPRMNGELDAAWATELYDLAMQGDVKELVERAEAAAERDPAGAPIYHEVQRLARKFDMKAIRGVLNCARTGNT
ncbi:MAG: GAF domain-containing sensor histidine kinase [Steroidobacteraceae bacterium]